MNRGAAKYKVMDSQGGIFVCRSFQVQGSTRDGRAY